MCFVPQRRALFRRLNFKKFSEPGVFCTFWLGHVLHFFDIATSKSVPALRCLVHFDLEMCFAPQRRAPFHHLNFQKWTETVNFLHILTWNLLRATTVCNFSSLTPSGGTSHWKKHCVSRLFYLFARLHLLSSDSFLWLFPLTFSSLSFSSLLFSSLLFSDSSHPCFSISPYDCWKFDFQTSFGDLCVFSAFGVFLGSPVLSLRAFQQGSRSILAKEDHWWTFLSWKPVLYECCKLHRQQGNAAVFFFRGMLGIAVHSSGKWSPRNSPHGVFRYWWEGAILSRPYRARLVSSLGECLRAGAKERSDVHRAGLRGKMFDDGLCIERKQRISGRHTTGSDVMKLWLIIFIPWQVFQRQLSFPVFGP